MLSFTRLPVSSNANPATRRKVLIAAPFAPRRDGLHGGSQVIARLVDELAEIHSVAVAYLRAPDEPPMEEALAKRCAQVAEVPRPGQPGDLTRSLRLLGAWARGYPMWVEDWRVPAFRDCLRDLIERWRPDMVQFEFHTMAQYVDIAGPYSAVLVEHEPGAAAARDRWQFSEGWRRAVLARDRRSWETYEREILARFDAVVCFTDRDRRALLELAPAARVEVIPPCGPKSIRTRASGAESPDNILFLGNFAHPPNVDAAIRMGAGIFPQVLARHPDAVLQLVGDAPPASVRSLAGRGVRVTGRVPDVKPFLEAAAVVVAPLRLGGGMRIKVMEALAFGKAVVATARATEGLNLMDGREILRAESDEAFAAAVSALLSDPELRQRMAAQAHEWAVQFGAPGRVGAAFDRLYRSVDRTRS